MMRKADSWTETGLCSDGNADKGLVLEKRRNEFAQSRGLAFNALSNVVLFPTTELGVWKAWHLDWMPGVHSPHRLYTSADNNDDALAEAIRATSLPSGYSADCSQHPLQL